MTPNVPFDDEELQAMQEQALINADAQQAYVDAMGNTLGELEHPATIQDPFDTNVADLKTTSVNAPQAIDTSATNEALANKTEAALEDVRANFCREFLKGMIYATGEEIQHLQFDLLIDCMMSPDKALINQTYAEEAAKMKGVLEAFQEFSQRLKACKLTGVKAKDAINLLPKLDDSGKLVSYPLSIPLEMKDYINDAGSQNTADFVRQFRNGVKPILQEKFNKEFKKKFPGVEDSDLLNKVVRNKETDFHYYIEIVNNVDKELSLTEVEMNLDTGGWDPTTCSMILPFDVFSQEYEVVGNFLQ